MRYCELSCEDFTLKTFSKDPVPGGGGVAAMAAALGAALGGMVASLTTGKKKYAAYEEDIRRLLVELEARRAALLNLIEEDAENFLPLSKAYGMPTTTDEEKALKAETLEACYKVAVGAPLKMIALIHECLPMFEELAEKGSRLALSDVGCGIELLVSAAKCAWLNVRINIKQMKDQDFIAMINSEYVPKLREIEERGEALYSKVEAQL